MYAFEYFEFFGSGVEAGEHFGVFEVLIVVVHEHFTCLFVEGGLGEGDDEKAFDDFKDVVEGPVGGVPVLLEGVDANLAFFGDVRMEDFGHEVAWVERAVPLGGLLGKSFSTASLHRKVPPS
jgi:hypothetical protein